MSREALADYIRRECMPPSEEFALSSGRRSSLYFDLKRLLFDGEYGSLAADELLEIMATRFPNVRVIGGEGVGGAAVIGQLFAAAQRKNYPIISAFLVYHRRENGLKVVSNVPPSGTDVIVVDDVATTGHALGIARDFVPQCNVVAGAVIIDRSQGDAERNLGFPVISVFSESAFVE